MTQRKIPHSMASQLPREHLRFLMDLSGNTEGFATNPQSKTISSGTIQASDELPFQFITVGTEGAAATDDLTQIERGKEGFIAILQAENDARTVVVKDGTYLKLGADFSLDHSTDKILLVCQTAGTWHEIFRSSNA